MKNDALNRTKLNSLSKDALILLQQSENFQLLSEQSSVIQKQNEQLIKQIESLKEHHIKVYAGDCDKGGILRAKAPNRLLSHSILTPELAAAVFNAKYVNAMPLNRLSEEFLRNDIYIPRQDMAGWMIRLADYYQEPVHKMMKAELLQSHHVHCDETPFIMPEHSKEYMWVFHSPEGPASPPIFLYEYLGGRKGQALTLAQEAASEAIRLIDMIYHRDNSFKESSTEERLTNRQQTVAPLVDAYFAWVKQTRNKICGSQKLTEALNYSFNQEPYLRVFLQDALIPLDNNDAERSIRSFCVGKHSWHIIDSVRGASASALLYSIAESAKANQLKPYEYFTYLLKELIKYPRENIPEEELKKLMPWSEVLPDSCRKNKTR